MFGKRTLLQSLDAEDVDAVRARPVRER